MLIEGVDQSIIKTGTIAHQISHGMSEEDDLYIFKPLRFRTRSVVKVCWEVFFWGREGEERRGEGEKRRREELLINCK